MALAAGTTTGAPPDQVQPPAPGAQQATSAAPPIVRRRIPYPASRRREMAAYSRMPYGPAYATWRLTPKVIVEHYTAPTGTQEVLNTFASDSPDAELGQLPGVCSHYLIDTAGTIMELVPPTIRCRHTVGLNHVYAPWRTQTHGDWSTASMRTFRARLGASGTQVRRP